MEIIRILFFCLIIGFSFFQNNALQAQCKGWLWTSGIGGDSSDDVECIVTDSINHFCYIAGSFTSDSLIFTVDTIINKGLRNAFVLKYDSLGNVLWVEGFGGNDKDYVWGLSIDKLGNIYCIGDYESDTLVVGLDTLINNGDKNFFIVKYAYDGSFLWAIGQGGDDYDFSQSIVCDNSGNFYAIGGYKSEIVILGQDTLVNEGETDVFIVRYDYNGEAVWAKTFGGEDIDFAEEMTADNSGFIYVAGAFQSDSLYIGSQLLLNNGAYDIFILKLDTDGNVVWVKGFGGNDYDRLEDFVVDSNGNIYITGNFNSDTIEFDNYFFINQGGSDIYYAKLDSNGNVIWANSTGGKYYEANSNIGLSHSNELYLSGCFRSQSIKFDSLIVIRNAYQTGFVTELDTSGVVIWAKALGAEDYKNDLEDFTINEVGDIYLTGAFRGKYISFGKDTLENKDVSGFYSDIYTLKLIDYASPPIPQITQKEDTLISDTAFNYQWYYDSDYIWQATHQRHIAQKSGFYLVEITDTNGCKACSEELFVLVTRILNNDFKECNTCIFPNPFKNSTLLKIDPIHEAPYSLKIISIDGKEVRNYSNFYSNEIWIKKENLQPGLYLYLLSNRHGTIRLGKILIQ
ncbi:MAG: T9SS type A sorting domain-containing protein [Lentimicrobiaceae bacterium]|nr:T9SS type A sorting domain-containing protein [Lentimicrobiaceae bacterium]